MPWQSWKSNYQVVLSHLFEIYDIPSLIATLTQNGSSVRGRRRRMFVPSQIFSAFFLIAYAIAYTSACVVACVVAYAIAYAVVYEVAYADAYAVA